MAGEGSCIVDFEIGGQANRAREGFRGAFADLRAAIGERDQKQKQHKRKERK